MKNSALWIVLHRMRAPLLVLIATYTISIIGLLLIDGVDDAGNVYHMNIFDSFYIVTYTATTIGFGELPYTFTYAQRIWMSMIIYATVMGWFYSLGTLVTLLQDKLLLAQLAQNRFEKQVRNLNQHFLIILGYNYITSEIIKKSNEEGVRVVVIEQDENKINELNLENYTPSVPTLQADVHDAKALEKAGINSPYCKAVIALFANDELNLRVALTTKLLNPNVKLAVKSTTHSHAEDLLDLGADVVENPFALIAEQIDMALNKPNMKVLQRWLYGIDVLKLGVERLPTGKYIVCGYGRMGKILMNTLAKNNIEAVVIEPKKKTLRGMSSDMREKIIIGSADDKELLRQAGIKEASVIIAATDNDTQNLSILTSAKKLNPDIFTIARENEVEDLSVFDNAKIDLVFIPARVLINKTTNYLIAPYASDFLDIAREHSDHFFSKKIVERIYNKIGENPKTFGLKIIEEKAYAIYRNIKYKNAKIELSIFTKSLHNREEQNNIIPLLLTRGKERFLLPDGDMQIRLGDKILFACDEEAYDDAILIANNKYEFHYAYTGEEKNTLRRLIKWKS
jgi:Trk K+ transport system NAD-binding subunit